MNGAVTPVPQYAFKAWTVTALHLRFWVFRITCILIDIWPSIFGLLPSPFLHQLVWIIGSLQRDRLPPWYPGATVTGIVLGVLSVTEKHLPHYTKPTLSDSDLSVRPLWHGRLPRRRLVAQRQTAGLPCPNDNGKSVAMTSRHTFLENERSRDCFCVGSKRTERRKKYMNGKMWRAPYYMWQAKLRLVLDY
jgi:hypothetical protein